MIELFFDRLESKIVLSESKTHSRQRPHVGPPTVREPRLTGEVGAKLLLREPAQYASAEDCHPSSSVISRSACSSQYVIPISRYIVVAVVRCSCASSPLPVRR